MNIVVFCGPTIPRGAVLEILPEAVVHPPAQQGDLYRAALQGPDAIALIDGYFRQVPSVWHKEILWALSNRIPVYGAASIGALRAAELDTMGMVGVGSVYAAYRDGLLEDDDEVAVAHASADIPRVRLFCLRFETPDSARILS